MEFIKQNGIYDFLVKKINEVYELPQKPENPKQYIVDNLEVLSFDKNFLMTEIHRLGKEND